MRSRRPEFDHGYGISADEDGMVDWALAWVEADYPKTATRFDFTDSK